MKIELSPVSQAKLEDTLEQLYTRYDLAELAPGELIDALLDVGVDLIVSDEPTSVTRDKLVAYCGQKVVAR